MFGGLRQRADAEDFLSGSRVDVFTIAEGLDEHRILREVGHDAELDLRIVGGEKDLARFGHEGGANLAPKLAADGNVLQIRIA